MGALSSKMSRMRSNQWTFIDLNLCCSFSTPARKHLERFLSCLSPNSVRQEGQILVGWFWMWNLYLKASRISISFLFQSPFQCHFLRGEMTQGIIRTSSVKRNHPVSTTSLYRIMMQQIMWHNFSFVWPFLTSSEHLIQTSPGFSSYPLKEWAKKMPIKAYDLYIFVYLAGI